MDDKPKAAIWQELRRALETVSAPHDLVDLVSGFGGAREDEILARIQDWNTRHQAVLSPAAERKAAEQGGGPA